MNYKPSSSKYLLVKNKKLYSTRPNIERKCEGTIFKVWR